MVSDPSRTALSEAIAARNGIERQLVAAKDAAEQAQRARWAAMSKLDALRQAREEAARTHSLGGAFVASIAAGSPAGADVLERQASTADIDAAERELEVWTQTQAECETLITQREKEISLAGLRVERLAHEVVRNCGAVAPLLDGLEAIADELDRRLAMLHFLDLRCMVGDADRPAVDSAISRMKRGHNYTHPAYAAWAAAIDALLRDAGAQLPEVENVSL